MKSIKEYKEILESNTSINLPVVARFLREGRIADYEVVSRILKTGLMPTDYQLIYKALDDLGYPEPDNLSITSQIR